MSLGLRLQRRLVESSPPAHCPELGPCLTWTGFVNPRGYGQINRGGRDLGLALTHRVSWEQAYGPIPDELNVLHRCDNPPCCRPDHLFLGTIADNNADMLAKGRYNVTPECMPRGSDNHNAKLTEEVVREARELHAQGMTGKSLAARYGVSRATMSSMLRRQTWTHVALILALALGLAACGSAPTAAPSVTPPTQVHEVTVTRVIDGDTVVITSPDGAETTVRILSIDSPETKKPGAPIGCWGPEASQYATTVLLNRMVVLVPDPTQDAVDRYGRTLAYVELADGPNAGQDFSTLAAAQGAARSYIYDPRHPPQRIGEIQAAERDAVQGRRGLWGACLTRPTR
jgi:micrococcal nuclease